ncbi:MAG: hydrogenase maturation protease [Proteobacteria bacterium]|nr:hydrogenase maturation protease [Pseudomonadota bacterium]
MMATGAIIGIGNLLQRDDGIGVKILKHIEARYLFPDSVELVDGGTCGATLNTSVANKEWLIVLDALNAAGNPGDVKVLPGEEFIDRPAAIKMSPHQVGFLDLVQLMRLEGTEPKRLDLIGIIPEDTDNGNTISPAVDQALDTAVQCLLDLLKKRDIVPVERDPAPKPDYWWLDP